MGRVNSIFLCFLTLQFWFAETETGSCWIYAAGYYCHWACRGTMGKHCMAEIPSCFSSWRTCAKVGSPSNKVLWLLQEHAGTFFKACPKWTEVWESHIFVCKLSVCDILGFEADAAHWQRLNWSQKEGEPSRCIYICFEAGAEQGRRKSVQKLLGSNFLAIPLTFLQLRQSLPLFLFQAFSLILQFYERPHVSITMKGCVCVCEPKYVAGLMGTCGRP